MAQKSQEGVLIPIVTNRHDNKTLYASLSVGTPKQHTGYKINLVTNWYSHLVLSSQASCSVGAGYNFELSSSAVKLSDQT